jgi:SAM-dependent methyltransferase
VSEATVSKNDPNCEICGASTSWWASIKGFCHFRCGSCWHLFVYPRPTQEELDLVYRQHDYYQEAENQRVRLQREARARAEMLKKLALRKGLPLQVLDVGCASGIFLGEAVREGWLARGVERSPTSATAARSGSNCDVDVGIFEEMDISGAPFPVVTAWEVLEHVINPALFFKSLEKVVRPGGLLAISTPLSDGFMARLLGRSYPMLIPPEHLSLFSRRSLEHIAMKHGFNCIEWRSFSNIGADSLASGFSKFVLRRDQKRLGKTAKSCVSMLGAAFSWVPAIIDRSGGGSEMEVVFQRREISRSAKGN